LSLAGLGSSNNLNWVQTPAIPGFYQYTEAPAPLIPRIRTLPKTFRIAEGQSVDLPCIVDNIGEKTSKNNSTMTTTLITAYCNFKV
jgi:hypothetical protein